MAIIILLVIALPVFTIVWKLFDSPGETWTHLVDTLLWDYSKNTLLLLLGTALFSAIIGVTAAWFIANYEFPLRKYFEWLLILPLAVPAYIMAYTYAGMLSYTGPIQTFFRNQLGWNTSGPFLDIMNIPGAMFILGISLFPYVYVMARSSFMQQSRNLQEASYLLGMGSFRTFFKVALPMARPAIAGGLSLIAMEVLNDYGTVKYFGVNTFTTGIFRAWFSLGDAGAAIYLSAILTVVVFALLWLETKQRGEASYTQGSNAPKPFVRKALIGWKKWTVLSFLISLFLVAFGFPIAQILAWVWATFHKVVTADFIQIILRSFSLAVGTGLFIVCFAIIMLYAVRLTKVKWLQTVSKLAVLGYAIPGAVIAVGIFIPLLQLDNVIIDVFKSLSFASPGLLFSGSVFTLIFAYIVRFLAVGFNPIDAGFQKVGRHVNEASRLLGFSDTKTLFKIDLPLIRNSIFSALLLVFVDVLKELPLTLILRPFNFQTLATKAFDMATNEMIAESANASLIIIMTGIIPVILLNRIIRTRKA